MTKCKVLPQCPLCKALPMEGSGGWAMDYICGTRRGHLTQSILWVGYDCYKATGKGWKGFLVPWFVPRKKQNKR